MFFCANIIRWLAVESETK